MQGREHAVARARWRAGSALEGALRSEVCQGVRFDNLGVTRWEGPKASRCRPPSMPIFLDLVALGTGA